MPFFSKVIEMSTASPTSAATVTANRQNAKKLLDELSSNQLLLKDINVLPANYNFEIVKTIWKIRTNYCRMVGLQFPEGLCLYARAISDLLTKYTGCETVIMADVAYGACCVDDLTAKELGCDLLVHYGHSCLVPIQDTQGILMLYVFVDIQLNTQHALQTIRLNFAPPRTLALVSTVQFVRVLQDIKRTLEAEDGYRVHVPQCKPLSPGEVLGCTSPKLPQHTHALIYIGDGRFHLESAMIANPTVPAFQYDPYSNKLTRETYDFELMNSVRAEAVNKAADAQTIGLILGTLGRQGNTKVYDQLRDRIEAAGKKCVQVLLSEIFPAKLALFDDVDCWVQVACPRLSIDWGAQFPRPLLTPYELSAALGQVQYSRTSYPMDYYATDSLGPWTNNHPLNRPSRAKPSRTTTACGDQKTCGACAS